MLVEATICCNTSPRPSSARKILPNRINSLICRACCTTLLSGGTPVKGEGNGWSSRCRSEPCSCSHCTCSAGERKRTRNGTCHPCCLRSVIDCYLFPCYLRFMLISRIAHPLQVHKRDSTPSALILKIQIWLVIAQQRARNTTSDEGTIFSMLLLIDMPTAMK